MITTFQSYEYTSHWRNDTGEVVAECFTSISREGTTFLTDFTREFRETMDKLITSRECTLFGAEKRARMEDLDARIQTQLDGIFERERARNHAKPTRTTHEESNSVESTQQ